MISRLIDKRLWVPPAEAAAAIGMALRAHWAAAKAAATSNPFWVKPGSWLERSARQLAPLASPHPVNSSHHFNSSHHLTTGGKLMRYASGSASVPNPKRVPRS